MIVTKSLSAVSRFLFMSIGAQAVKYRPRLIYITHLIPLFGSSTSAIIKINAADNF